MAEPEIIYVGMIPGNPSMARKLAGIRRCASSHGWKVETLERRLATPGRVRRLLAGRRPAGCVVEGIGAPHHLRPAVFGAVPFVYLEYPADAAGGAPNVVVDEAAVAAEAFRELSAGLPSSYACVGPQLPGDVWARGRIAAFKAEVSAKTGLDCPLAPEIRPGEDNKGFLRRMAAWIAALPPRCAIFATSDLCAMRVVEAARLAGRPIPKDISLVSVDNHPDLCEASSPTISSIQIDHERMGYLAAAMLGEAKSATIAPLMVVRRESTAGRGRRKPWILKAVDVIRREAREGLTAEALASRFPVSRRLFDLRFREAMGHSAYDEILAVRMETAHALLARPEVPVGVIADMCGFASPIALHRYFRRHNGCSMTEWRRRNGGSPGRQPPRG